MAINDQLTDNTLQQITDNAGAKLWIPKRTLQPIDTTPVQIRQLQAAVIPPAVLGTTVPQIVPGVPFQLLSISATQAPSKQQDRVFSQVAVTFTRDAGDPSYGTTRIYLKGYKGNHGRVLETEAHDSPVIFLLEATGETITIIGAPVGSDGTPASIELARSCTVTLNGQQNPPPGPTITQSLIAVPDGYQFTFTQLPPQLADVIDNYKVYVNTVNNSGTATVVRTFKHDPKNAGAPIVFQDTVTDNNARWYWVSAVDTMGLESVLEAAGTSNPWNASTNLNPQGSIASISGLTFTYSATTTSITWSWTAGTAYRLDNTSIAIAGGTAPAITGLSPSSTYIFDAYYDLLGAALHVILSDNGSLPSSLQQLATVVNVDGHVPIRISFSASTPASGTGGGNGGGGNDSCFTGNTRILTKRGIVEFRALRAGDFVLTAVGTWRKVIEVTHRSYMGSMYDMGGDELVTPSHEFLKDEWRRADEVLDGAPMTVFTTIWNAHIEGDSYDEHSYTLANGLVAHNQSFL